MQQKILLTHLKVVRQKLSSMKLQFQKLVKISFFFLYESTNKLQLKELINLYRLQYHTTIELIKKKKNQQKKTLNFHVYNYTKLQLIKK